MAVVSLAFFLSALPTGAGPNVTRVVALMRRTGQVGTRDIQMLDH